MWLVDSRACSRDNVRNTLIGRTDDSFETPGVLFSFQPAFCEEPEQLDPLDCVGVLERCLPWQARPLHFSNKPGPITHSLQQLQDQRLFPLPGCSGPRWL